MATVDFLVEPDWLRSRLERSNSAVLDATWIMPGSEVDLPKGQIPGAQFFDIDLVATPHPSLSHMLPSATQFENTMSELGIKRDDHVICYDRHGIFSSPRLWWTLRMFGHEKVSILNGGLPAWIKAGYETTDSYSPAKTRTSYETQPALSGVIAYEELLSLLPSSPQIVDARPADRFLGKAPEPRADLKPGHIPGSVSLPLNSIVRGGRLLEMDDITKTINAAGIDLRQPIITTCGSGITATGLAFIFHRLGARDVRVYDGSWSEWGASDAPIEV